MRSPDSPIGYGLRITRRYWSTGEAVCCVADSALATFQPTITVVYYYYDGKTKRIQFAPF
jgi:hypothetical protein